MGTLYVDLNFSVCSCRPGTGATCVDKNKRLVCSILYEVYNHSLIGVCYMELASKNCCAYITFSKSTMTVQGAWGMHGM